MRKLGISLYPEHSTPEKDRAYMEKAADLGFQRIFTCFLSAQEDRADLISHFTRFMQEAHDFGFTVSVDTNRSVMEKLGASAQDLGIFHEIGADIVRLDSPMSEAENIYLTNNPYGIQIEFNASYMHPLALYIEKGARRSAMTLCHNFYPQEFTGLSIERFEAFNHHYAASGLPIAAFVSSQAEDTFGPWPVYKGLPTLEIHRSLPIDLQARQLISLELVEDILIGNCFASDEELLALAQVDLSKITLQVQTDAAITPLESEILFDNLHADRADASSYLVRSSLPRIRYGQSSIPPRPCAAPAFQKGDVLVVNDQLRHYRGELQIVREEMPNRGDKNLVGHLDGGECFILDRLRPQHVFRLIQEGRIYEG